MVYYSINKSYIKKVIGNYPQQIDLEIDGSVNSELCIDKFFLKEIDFEPLIPRAILHKNAKLTDLIATNGIGFSFTLLISSKLKEIFESFDIENFQFFKSNVVLDGQEIDGYWLMNPTREYMEKIDFKNSEIYISKISMLEKVDIDSWVHFQEVRDKLKNAGYNGKKGSYQLTFDKIVMKDFNTTPMVYLRYKRGSGYFVSEIVKNTIEATGCTGIEFMPSNMPYLEWSAPGGYREKVYGDT